MPGCPRQWPQQFASDNAVSPADSWPFVAAGACESSLNASNPSAAYVAYIHPRYLYACTVVALYCKAKSYHMVMRTPQLFGFWDE